MAEKKYVGAEALIRLVAQLKTGFASMVHKHKIKDIEDYVVDVALSDTSTNPVENKAIKAEFQAITNILTSKADVSDLTNGSFVVKNAEHAGTTDFAVNAENATKATQDASGNIITGTYETKTDASAKLEEAKSYADSAATTVKNDLLNGAGEAYDTLKELGELIDENHDAIAVLNEVAAGKAEKEHGHVIADVTSLQETIDALQSNIDTNEESILALGSNVYSKEEVDSKIYGSGGNIVWDGDITDREFISTPELPEFAYYKVADANGITATDLYGQTITLQIPAMGQSFSETITVDTVDFSPEMPGFGSVFMLSLGEEDSSFPVMFFVSNESVATALGITTGIYFLGTESAELYVSELTMPGGGGHSHPALESRIAQVKNMIVGRPGEGTNSVIFGGYVDNSALGSYAFAQGLFVSAPGDNSHAQGESTIAGGRSSHAEGEGTKTTGIASHAEGEGTVASSDYQHVQGRYNIEDAANVYAHIVGNGEYQNSQPKCSNAHTLDWDGNAWYAGTIKVGGTSYADATELLTNTPSSLVNLGMPGTATIGQTAIVKTIDENGMPIEWEAADLGNITIDEDGNAWFGTAEEIYKIPEGLPDYTDDDEGKILSVVDGMAAWTENKGGSGGGGGIVVSETEPTDESVIFWVQI